MMFVHTSGKKYQIFKFVCSYHDNKGYIYITAKTAHRALEGS